MLSQFCIRRPIFATVLSIIIVLAGLLTLRVLPLSQYPNISPPSVMISTTYEGADSQTIARTVAAPIEDQLSGIEGLLYYTSSIRSNGDIRIQCVFDVGTDANDAMLEINNRVRTAERRLPDRVRNEGVRVRKRNNDTLLMMAMWSPDGSYAATDIADYANLNIVDELKRIPGIGDVSVFGNAQSAMRIWLDPDRMGALGVTVKDVNDAIETQNAQRTAGRVGVAPTIPEQQLFYTVRTPGQLLTPEQFANVIVRADGPNGIVRLRDIAATEVGKRSYEFRVDINGAPGVNVGVYLQTGANAVAAAELVKAKVAELATHYPKGKIAHLITDDTTVFVEASLTEVYRTLAEAGFLVLLVVFVFLQSWRATLIPIIAVPVSLIGTMAGLWLLDFSLNTLTLFAMTLSIGIVVDDAIVVLENVERIMRTEGLGPYEASQKAMKEVAGALVAIVLVLSSVFIPVAFLGGIAGELYRQFAVTVSVAVILSGFVALTLTPALCAIFLKPHDADAKRNFFFTKFNQGLAALTMRFLQLVRLALKHRVVTAVLLVVVTAGAWQMIQRIPTSFIPTEDQGIVRMALQLPEGAAFPRTEKVVDELYEKVRSNEAVRSVVTMVGFDTLSSDQRANAATFITQLKHWDERTKSASDVQKEFTQLLASHPDVRGVATTPGAIPGLGATNGFSGYVLSRGNDNPLVLQEVMDVYLDALAERPELTSLRSFLRADSPQLVLSVDEAKAIALGVSVDEVYDSISTLMGSSYINDFTRNGKIYRVVMQAKADARATPEDLGRGYVRSSSGEMIPISSLISYERISGADTLARMNGYLAAQFMGAAAQGVSSGDAIRIAEEVGAAVLPEGYTIEWTGQAYHEKRIGSSSATAFGFGLLMMFLILAALYERWSLPIAVVLAVPYAVLGAMCAIWIRGTPNDIYFQIGLMVLVGLTAKNAILIVEVARRQRSLYGRHRSGGPSLPSDSDDLACLRARRRPAHPRDGCGRRGASLHGHRGFRRDARRNLHFDDLRSGLLHVVRFSHEEKALTSPVRSQKSPGRLGVPGFLVFSVHTVSQPKKLFMRSKKDCVFGLCFVPPSLSDASKSRRSCFCLDDKFTGVSICTWRNRSPGSFVRRFATPLSRRRKVFPFCVPSGIVTWVLPSRVGTSTVPPRAAVTNEIGSSACRSSPSREKISWGLRRIST